MLREHDQIINLNYIMEYIVLANIGYNVIYTTHNQFSVTRYLTLNENTVTMIMYLISKQLITSCIELIK